MDGCSTWSLAGEDVFWGSLKLKKTSVSIRVSIRRVFFCSHRGIPEPLGCRGWTKPVNQFSGSIGPCSFISWGWSFVV